jgi:hypothetical protein
MTCEKKADVSKHVAIRAGARVLERVPACCSFSVCFQTATAHHPLLNGMVWFHYVVWLKPT